MSYSALVVEDDANAALIISEMLTNMGFSEVSVASSIVEAQDVLPGSWNLVICDELLPDGSGVDLASWLRPQRPDAIIAISTVVDDQAQIRKAFSIPVNYFVVKPNGLKRLMKARGTIDTLLDPTARDIFTGR